MKKMKILGLIALVMVIGLFAVACDGECDHAEDKLDEWEVVTAATLAAEGLREATCECGVLVEENIPRWEALFGTTWWNNGSQFVKITEEKFELNVRTPTGITIEQGIDFSITDWEYTTVEDAHGLTAPVTAFELTGTMNRIKGYTTFTKFKITVTEAGGHFKMFWSGSTNVYGGQTFVTTSDTTWVDRGAWD